MKVLLLSLLLLAPSAFVAAQGEKAKEAKARPDLSGTWVFDKSKSEDGGTGRYTFDELTLVIVHREPELRITRKTVREGKESAQELVYYTDGRGETNRALTGDESVTSKTSWRKNSLQVVQEQRHRAGSHFFYLDVTDRWELSKDGRLLTQTTRVEESRTRPGPGIFIPAPSGDFKRVFVRAP